MRVTRCVGCQRECFNIDAGHATTPRKRQNVLVAAHVQGAVCAACFTATLWNPTYTITCLHTLCHATRPRRPSAPGHIGARCPLPDQARGVHRVVCPRAGVPNRLRRDHRHAGGWVGRAQCREQLLPAHWRRRGRVPQQEPAIATAGCTCRRGHRVMSSPGEQELAVARRSTWPRQGDERLTSRAGPRQTAGRRQPCRHTQARRRRRSFRRRGPHAFGLGPLRGPLVAPCLQLRNRSAQFADTCRARFRTPTLTWACVKWGLTCRCRDLPQWQ